MPYYTDSLGAEAPLADYAPSLGLSIEAAASDAFESNPTRVASEFARFRTAQAEERMPNDEAAQRIKDAGVKLKVPEEGYSAPALEQLIERKRDEIARQSVLSRAPAGVVGTSARFATQLAVSMLDPLNIASAFVPVVGPARYAAMIEGAGGALGRMGVRASVGAAEGAVGAAIIEPLLHVGRTQMQDDYSMTDSLANIAFGGVFGGGLHVVGGAIGDAFRGPVVRHGLTAEDASGLPHESAAHPEAAATPLKAAEVTPESAAARVVALTPEGREATLRVSVAQAMEGRVPDVAPVAAIDREANLRAFMDGSKVVDEAGAPLRLLHGTTADFDSFHLAGSEYRNGLRTEGAIWLTPRPETANFAATDLPLKKGASADGANVMPVFASVKNPLIVDSWDAYPSKAKISDLVKSGHDGVIVSADGSVRNATEVIAFHPGQVKSAIGNSGRFDPTSASLTDPIAAARVVSERQAAPESVAIADFPASRAADERIAAAPTPESAVETSLQGHMERLTDLMKNLVQRGTDSERVKAMRATLEPFEEAVKDAAKLGDAMRAAAICGVRA